jgi:hypothetical protein
MNLNEQRLDYAWKWFSFHADQRTKMFNFMLVGLGLFAGALVTALDKQLYPLAALMGVAGFALAVGFYFIDRRNKQLYEAALDVLFDLEQFHLFSKDGTFTPRHDGQQVPFAIGWRVHQDDRINEGEPSLRLKLAQGRHRLWMPLMILGLGLVFLIVGAGAGVLWMQAPGRPAIAAPAPASPGSAATGVATPASGAALPVVVTPTHTGWSPVLLAAGLALALVGAAAWLAGRRVTAATSVAAGVLMAAASSLGLSFTGEVKVSPEFKFDLLKDLKAELNLQWGSGATPKLLGSHRFEGFASGASTLACPPGEALADLRGKVQTLPKGEDVVVLAVGGTDREPLGPPLRRQLESNAGLARARVDTALGCLALKLPEGASLRVLPLVTGPAYTPQRDASPAAAAQAMQADRAVDLHVLAVPRGVSPTR